MQTWRFSTDSPCEGEPRMHICLQQLASLDHAPDSYPGGGGERAKYDVSQSLPHWQFDSRHNAEVNDNGKVEWNHQHCSFARTARARQKRLEPQMLTVPQMG